MNRDRRLRCLCLIAVLVLSTASLLTAQNHPRRGTFNAPFDFYISGIKFAAGEYTLDAIAPTYALLRSKDGKSQQDLYFLQTAVPSKNTPTQVIFALRDGKYYFSQVWSWFGKAQLSSFTPRATDQTKDVPLKAVEKDVAKPAAGL